MPVAARGGDVLERADGVVRVLGEHAGRVGLRPDDHVVGVEDLAAEGLERVAVGDELLLDASARA